MKNNDGWIYDEDNFELYTPSWYGGEPMTAKEAQMQKARRDADYEEKVKSKTKTP